MQIVIDIEDSVYHQIKQHGEVSEFHKLIIHSTPLPKGHGRLIDADALIKSTDKEDVHLYEIALAPTIIEADKAERSE